MANYFANVNRIRHFPMWYVIYDGTCACWQCNCDSYNFHTSNHLSASWLAHLIILDKTKDYFCNLLWVMHINIFRIIHNNHHQLIFVEYFERDLEVNAASVIKLTGLWLPLHLYCTVFCISGRYGDLLLCFEGQRIWWCHSLVGFFLWL